MKFSTCLLAVSFTGNLVLAAFMLSRNESVSIAKSHFSVFSAPVSDRTSPSGPSSSSKSRSSHTGNLWSQLYSEDPVDFSKRLRAAGFPRDEMLTIVAHALSRKFDAERIAITGRREDIPYWKQSSFYGSAMEDPKKRGKLTELSADESKLFRKISALYDDIENDPDTVISERRHYGELSIEKLKQLNKIESDYQDLCEDVYMRRTSTGELTKAERQKLALLESERLHDIQQALSATEFNEYQLRNSSTAQSLRSNLQLFQPTETEYKTLFAIINPVDQQFQSVDRDADENRNYREALNRLKPQIEAALGSERYADYIQATEHGTDRLNRLMARLNLPLSTSGKVTDIRQDITNRAKAIRDDASLDNTARSAQLSRLADEAKTKLTTTLGGPRGYNAYEDIKGDWIRALQPKPATTAKP